MHLCSFLSRSIASVASFHTIPIRFRHPHQTRISPHHIRHQRNIVRTMTTAITDGDADERFDPEVQYLAVYGSLRDDDDSGQSWTRDFIQGRSEAFDGRVLGADIYWDTVVGYPKVILQKDVNQTNGRKMKEELTKSSSPSSSSLPASPPPSSSTPTPASPSTLPMTHVRLLSWSTRSAFVDKMIRADEIELYDPANESNSEYVRRRVRVCRRRQRTSSDIESSSDVTTNDNEDDFVDAWMYVMIAGTQPDPAWIRLEHGDWMKRDRNTTHK